MRVGPVDLNGPFLRLRDEPGFEKRVPDGIVAYVDDGSLDFDVTLRITVDQEQLVPVIDSAEIRRRPGGPPVDPTHIRKVPLDRLMHEAVEMATTRWEIIEKDGQAIVRMTAETLSSLGPTGVRLAFKKRPRNQVTDEDLRAVVRAYEKAKIDGLRDPFQVAAAAVDRSRSTAAAWIKKARQKGIQ